MRGLLDDGHDIKVHFIHNPQEMINLKLSKPVEKKYFILRPTIERIVGQFVHYSRNLKNIGRVNHLVLDDLREESPGFNPDDPYQFIRLKSNQNVYCKFLLGRTDFNQPITNEDFEKVKAMFTSDNKPIWDLYSKPIEVLNLEKLLGIGIVPEAFRQSPEEEHNKLLNNKGLIEEIEKLNSFDIKLYEFLTK